MGQFIIAYIATKLDALFFDRHHTINNFVSQMLHCWWVGSVILAIKPVLSWAMNDAFVCTVQQLKSFCTFLHDGNTNDALFYELRRLLNKQERFPQY